MKRLKRTAETFNLPTHDGRNISIDIDMDSPNALRDFFDDYWKEEVMWRADAEGCFIGGTISQGFDDWMHKGIVPIQYNLTDEEIYNLADKEIQKLIGDKAYNTVKKFPFYPQLLDFYADDALYCAQIAREYNNNEK